jgi:hypothetical protein
VSETTGYSAFFLLYGREAVLPIEAEFTETQFVDLEQLLTTLQKARACAKENIEITQIKNASYHDVKVREHTLKVGDTVVCRKYVRKPGLSPKLTLQYYYGPYTIVELPTEVTAIIETKDKSGKTHRERVHVEKLKSYFKRDGALVDVSLPSDEQVAPVIEGTHQAYKSDACLNTLSIILKFELLSQTMQQ